MESHKEQSGNQITTACVWEEVELVVSLEEEEAYEREG